MSKRFYDTSTGAAIGADRCGSFVGEGFGLLVVVYERTWWTPRFTWFRPQERNTLRPWENRVVLHKPGLARVSLSLFSAVNLFLTPVKRCLPDSFIAQGWVVTMGPRARQVDQRRLKLYTSSRMLMGRSS
jgi:hypothetical protein